MNNPWAALSRDELLVELDSIERAIACSHTFHLCANEAGRTQVRVSPELLALAEREHHVVAELRRRQRTSTMAA